MTKIIVLGDQETYDVREDCYVVDLTEEELVSILNGEKLRDILSPDRFVPLELKENV
tara:strand:+ start:349 stop:519 length:171 start_codon:yes stop_codon:yes gene_type:complete